MIYLRRNPGDSAGALALRRDGWWYVRIAQGDYSTSLRPRLDPVTDWRHVYSDWAFYPGYPIAIRVVHELLDLPYLVTALALAGVFGLLAVWALYALGEQVGGIRAARAGALLFAAWPGSAVFALPYSEGLFLAATALALLELHRERWVLAGLLGAVATLTRPTGFALVAAAAAVAVVRLARDRQWRPLLAPVLSASGAGAFVVYGWWRTGDPFVWRHAENLWRQRLDFSLVLLRASEKVLLHPRTAVRTPVGRAQLAASLIDLVGLIVLVAMAVAAVLVRRRLTKPMVVYALVSTAMIVGYSAVAPRPRTVLAVLPGFVWLGMVLPRRAVLAVSAVGLAGLAVFTYLGARLVVP